MFMKLTTALRIDCSFFVHNKFLDSLMLASKDGVRVENFTKSQYMGRLLALPAKANHLAYFATKLTIKKNIVFNINTCCQFHKHFMAVYDPNKVSCTVHCMHAAMQCFLNALAYFATAVSYDHKTHMKWTPVVNVIKLFTAVSYEFSY
jgi:hypothetical protein